MEAFPVGLRVLVVDDDPTWLKILEKMLRKCYYEVTTCGLARVALDMLRERRDRFDIVISDVNMPDMDGFKLLEQVGLEMDLPVIMMSVDGETSRVMKGVQHGACDYLLKPIRMKELKNIWQHVFRKKINEIKGIEHPDGLEEFQLVRSKSEHLDGRQILYGSDLNSTKKRKDISNKELAVQDIVDSHSVKKARVVWSVDLHQNFVNAVNQIGYDKVGPKKILDLMNVPGLSREKVASHLQYAKFVKPAFDDFILPSKKHADVIIPRGGDNHVAIDLIVQHIRTKLGQHDLCKIYPNVYVIHSTFQIRGMHTLIRDRDIATPDFVFYSDRLIRLVVEHGLGHLPFMEKQVVTPTGSVYTGVDFCKKLCGVSIVRSGESMENALRACCKGIKIGKILIHREGDNGKQLIYEKLPNDIAERHVLLLDPVLGTGNSANQAIELILQKGVPENHIIFLNLISAPEGIHCVCKRFPSVKIVTSEIDAGLNEEYRVIPGLGEYGDRYFGTE